MEHKRKASYLPGNPGIASNAEYGLSGREVSSLIEKLLNKTIEQAHTLGQVSFLFQSQRETIQVLQSSFMSSIHNRKPSGIPVRKRSPENQNTFSTPISSPESTPYQSPEEIPQKESQELERKSTPLSTEEEKSDAMEFNHPTAKMTSHVYMAMPTPGTAGALSFDGKDITIFLKRFEKLCKGHGITTDEGILEQIPDYCTLEIGNYMENTTAFKGNNWKEFCKAMKRRFRDKDTDQIIHTPEYLMKFVSENETTMENAASYVYRYTAISEKVKEKGMISEYSQATWFMEGLPEKIRDKIAEMNYDPEEPETMKFKLMIEKALELIKSKKKYKSANKIKQLNVKRIEDDYSKIKKYTIVALNGTS